MMKLTGMGVKQLREIAVWFGADRNRLYGTSITALKIIVRDLIKKSDNGEKWYVVVNGNIVFSGSELECGYMISKDITGDMEMYPEEGRI